MYYVSHHINGGPGQGFALYSSFDDGDDHVYTDHGDDHVGHSHDDADDDGRVPVGSRVKLGGSEDDTSSASLPSHSTMMQKGSS